MKKFKKIIWIFILLIVVGIITFILINTKNTSTIKDDSNTTTANRVESPKQTNTTKTNDTSNLVIGDNYFITQINDIYYNMNDYVGREIEIEGFPLSTPEYKFVSRYGPGCCTGDGYAYIEYTYNQDINLVDEEDWIKVKGILKKDTYQGKEYIYIEATSVEKMATRGKDTVID